MSKNLLMNLKNMTDSIAEKFLKQIQEVDNFIREKQKIDSDNRCRNSNSWKILEKHLKSVQGMNRSDSFKKYKMLSLNLIPCGSKTIDMLVQGMTDDERKILNR